jgi:hypothetical protein
VKVVDLEVTRSGLTVADLAALDLSYAPPFAPVYDPVLTAAIKAASGTERAAASITGGPP